MVFLPWNAKHFSPYTTFQKLLFCFCPISSKSIPPLHTGILPTPLIHHFDFRCNFYISVFPDTGQYNSLLSSQCYASFNFFGAISICWLVWSQEFKVMHLLQWFSFMVHLHQNIVLSADHHYLGLLSLCIDIHVVACTFLYQIFEKFPNSFLCTGK